jgi:hypothetical protein
LVAGLVTGVDVSTLHPRDRPCRSYNSKQTATPAAGHLSGVG